jgi:hypothetical protein
MLADPDTTQVQALTTRLIATLEQPAVISSSELSVCEQVLSTAGLPKEVYDRALSLLAAVIYWRPDLVCTKIVASLELLFAGRSLPPAIHRHASEVLSFLLATPAAPHTLNLLLRMLARPGRPSTEYSDLLDSLAYASSWAASRLDLDALIALAEAEHLAGQRERLLHEAIERAMFARPASVTVHLLEHLVRRYEGHPTLKYLLFYLAGRADVRATVRSTARLSSSGRFPLHELVHQRLGSGKPWVLIVQNIADAQGDEIIRVVPLLESLLCFNPLLELMLITNREYLYAHSRLTLVPIDDRASVQSVLRDRFDAVIDFYDSSVPEVNYDEELEQQVAACVQRHAPFLQVGSQKGWNTFLYQRVDVESCAHADALGLDRQRVENVYETTFRLIAELGLPLRLGEETPGADSVLAGLPCPEAGAAWSALLEGNTQRRPAALLCPFGGAEPLKGYVERQADLLADEIRRLIVEGFYVVLLPNGMPWGSASLAHKVVGHLAPSEQEQVVVAPDPADGRGAVRYEHAGRHTVPYASYQMRLVTYFVRFADLIVTVEGWMVHAAYCLGKRYRVLMLPDSYPSEWHPYGRTLHQDVVAPAPGVHPSVEEAVAPPLPAQPRKFVLLFLLRSLGRSDDARAVPVLRWALRSEDWHVRLAAAQSLSRFSGPDVDAALRVLLADPANRVRGAVASALLDRMADTRLTADELPREHLVAHQLIGREPRDWVAVLRLGESARSALRTAVQDDHPVVRREAAWAIQALDRRLVRARRAELPRLAGRMSEPAGELLRAGKSGSARLAALLRGLSRRSAHRRAP